MNASNTHPFRLFPIRFDIIHYIMWTQSCQHAFIPFGVSHWCYHVFMDIWIIADGRGVEPRKLLRSPHFECGCSPFAPPSIQLSNYNLLSICSHACIESFIIAPAENSFSTLCIRCQRNHSCIHFAFMSSERAEWNRTIATDWIVGILPLYDRRMNTWWHKKG